MNLAIPPLAHDLEATLRAKINAKTKPLGALGRLEEIALRIGLMQATLEPTLQQGTVLVFAGDHGLAAEGVSPFPAEVTAQMIANFLSGGAAINVFAKQNQLALKVVDAGVAVDLPNHPTLIQAKIRHGSGNARWGEAMTAAEVTTALQRGGEIVDQLAAQGCNAVLLGEMGIGNSSAAALLMSCLLGLPLEACIGRGAGHDAAGLAHKAAILQEVQDRHSAVRGPLEALAAFGGCEIAMLAGAMLGAARRRMVILNDGFIVTAALLCAAQIEPRVLDYVICSHCSAEQSHARLLAALSLQPLLNLELRLGEGTGAALAWPLLQAACGFLREMATFESAAVSGRSAGGTA